MPEGPRIYNLFPRLLGPISRWKTELPRIAQMNFNWVFVNPFHYPGHSGSLYAVKDHYRLNPLFRGRSRKSDQALLRDFLRAAENSGLNVMMDLVLNHTAEDAVLVDEHPEWFARDSKGGIKHPSAIDPDDARKVTVWGDLAEIDYSDRPTREEIVAYWQDVVRHYAELGFHGFRCDAAYKVPAEVWTPIINTAREVRPGAVFFAETLGCRLEEVEQLRPAGFDFLFNSAKWWDFSSDWLLKQYNDFRHIAPSIAFPESHDTERLATDLSEQGITETGDIAAAYRQRYLFSAVFSTGVMMPMGFEFGWRKKLDVVHGSPDDREDAAFDISDDIAAANALKRDTPVLNEEGPQKRIALASESVVGLLRYQSSGSGWTLTLINKSPDRQIHLPAGALEPPAGAGVSVTEIGQRNGPGETHLGEAVDLPPFGIRVFEGSLSPSRPDTAVRAPEREADTRFMKSVTSRPIVIQNVYPEIDCGRFPIKRKVGEVLKVWADIFREGHEHISAVLRYRPIGGFDWLETPMTLEEPGLDRWRGCARLERIGRYVYTIEAWDDPFESWCEELEKKRAAGQPIALELLEGRNLVEQAVDRAGADDARGLRRVLDEFAAAHDDDKRAALLTSHWPRRIMANWPDRSRAVRYDRELEVVVGRERAHFAAWYEMFPRSQGTEPGKSATFRDCENRIPEIAEMGFDVIYLPPIHPIGATNRKGPNNTLDAGGDHPGSPYAIGSAEGGHTAVHPELGDLEDFRRFVRKAEEYGIEIALDFAIQCSPDHPWITEHPEWFQFRPDGTIKHAENPPKKYEDIVNVNFYGTHQDELWEALRDVVLFWVEQGVKTFRVDNPHTKPIPFWEWLINEVQREHPDAVFLSEAFTRPRMLEMLAKIGFTQSYTYFTWRNFKGELTDYLTELTRTSVREYLQPNFFANTPDILPQILQVGGRPAFQIRLVLAATLSTVYGIYNGFELCENRAVPGTEEYLDSEKYEYKVWDWDRPGNIKPYIAAINRIRRDNPALHAFTNIRFLPAQDENVLFYGKMTDARDNMIFVAVNLDPFEPHETECVFPLHDMGIPEDEAFEVEELLTGQKHLWRGAHQTIRLDPATNPAQIYRVSPWAHVDYREPCF